MRPVCIRNFKKPRRKLNQVNVRKDFWGFTFRLLFSFLEGELTRLVCKPRCVCVLTSFCCSVLLFRSGATESVPIDVACKNLQISVVSFRQRGLGSGWIPLSLTFPMQSKCTRHWGSRQKRATCFATVLQNLRVLPLRNEPDLSCNISGSYRWRKVVAESRD